MLMVRYLTSNRVVEHQWLVDWYLRGRRFDQDARQCGMVGLCEAEKRFKPELGFAFSTYASFWVRREVSRYRDHQKRWSHIGLVEEIFVEGSAEFQQPAVELMLDIKKLLPPKIWVIFRMKFGRGMSDTQISEVMKCTRQWVNSLVQNGLRIIKAHTANQ